MRYEPFGMSLKVLDPEDPQLTVKVPLLRQTKLICSSLMVAFMLEVEPTRLSQL